MMAFFVIAFCFAWGIYCGWLTHLLDQPLKADAVASFIGFLIIIVASSQ